MCLVEELRKKRDNTPVVILTRFMQDCNDCQKLVCFFEGEDRKYYAPRIETILNEEFVQYNCGGKSKVFRVYELIREKEVYNKFRLAFFVDKDFDEVKSLKDIYTTCGYSIENHYVSKGFLEKILRYEFGINKHENDFKRVISDFEKRSEEFYSLTSYLNGWLKYQKNLKNESNDISLDKLKLKDIINDISIDNKIMGIEISEAYLQKLFPNVKCVDEIKMQEKIDELKTNPSLLFRGKYNLYFMKKILEDILNKNRKEEYFSQKYPSVHMNVTNNFLSNFSLYADTPRCLEDFLKRYKSSSIV